MEHNDVAITIPRSRYDELIEIEKQFSLKTIGCAISIDHFYYRRIVASFKFLKDDEKKVDDIIETIQFMLNKNKQPEKPSPWYKRIFDL